jgi:glycosyltransferase involved in cell wall biosynthesis
VAGKFLDQEGEMKIISIVTSFPRNDKDVLIPWIIRLIKELKSKDVESEVFTSSYCGMDDEEKGGIKVRRFRYFLKRWEKLSHDMSVPEKLKSDKRYFLVLPFFMLFGIISAYRFGKKNDFNMIHVHFPFPLALFGIAMKIASKKPMIVSCHGSEVNMAKKNRVFRVAFKWMMKYADKITVNSGFMKNELTKIVGNREIEIIPMGCGIGDCEIKDYLKKRKNNERAKILFVGRLIEWKGVRYLIEAVKMLDSQKYELHIVGDGPERKGLEELDVGDVNSEQKGSETVNRETVNREEKKPLVTHHASRITRHPSRITFHGYLTGTALEEMYRSADVFVLPSIVDDQGYTEGLGTVLLEAISFGVPVIGSNVGGIPDIIIDGKTGFLVSQKDAKSIAQAVEKIVDNPELAEELTKKALNHLAQNFSWEMITNKFTLIYKSLSFRRGI